MFSENYNSVKLDIIKLDLVLKENIQQIWKGNFSEKHLNSEALFIRQKLNQLKNYIDEFKRIIHEECMKIDQIEVEKDIELYEKLLQSNHQAFRKAILSAQLAISQRNKDELLADRSESLDDANLRHRKNFSSEAVIRKSSQLTDDLLSVTRMIKENTEKNVKTVNKLVESSQTIGSTQEELKVMDSVIAQAKKILTKYGRRENTDKLLIFLGLVFFFASCLVVIRNRFGFF